MITRTYIPAQPGQTVYIIHVIPEDGARPTADDIFVETHAVIAWRITAEDLTEDDDVFGEPKEEFVCPVLVESYPPETIFWHVQPNGDLCSPEDRTVSDLEEVKRITLKTAQDTWDRKREKAAATAAEQEPPPKTGELTQQIS